MRRNLSSVALASIAAGPIFFVSAGLAAAQLALPAPIALEPGEIHFLALAIVPAVLCGFVLSIIPNLIGSRFLRLAGEAFPAARARPAWIGSGLLFGGALAWLLGAFDSPAIAFGLVFTSACCAAICRDSDGWD